MNNDLSATTVAPLTSEDGGFFFGLFDSAIGIILFIILVLIALLVIWFIYKKLMHKVSVTQEKRSIKDDLMIWSTLSNLVSGGKNTKKGKEDLSGNIHLLKHIFETSIDFIKIKNFLKLKAPWFIMLGEPLSGKSSLLSSDTLDFDRARKDLDPKDTEAVHFCVNRETVFLDVKGKIFFDHWLGGSSAEWHAICELINKYHHAKPLSGIVLTIPADALIADDKKLSLKKAELIASELGRLAATLKMNLPCRIVITKSDCILGFREYFESLSDKLREQAIGFTLDSKKGLFVQDIFNSTWRNFIERIKDGVFGLMLSKKVIDTSYDDKNRIDVSSSIYSFHENLDVLKENLEIYLSTIFDSKFAVQPASIEGIFFTSSLDQGVCFNADFAKYQGKKIDDAILADDKKSSNNSFFISKLFGKLLINLDRKSEFTKKERMRRNIPAIMLGAALTILSCNYLTGALAGHRLIYKNLGNDADFYRTLTILFNRNSIHNSPLLDVNEETAQGVTRFNEQMVSDSKMSRMNFFNAAKQMLLSDKPLPFIYSPSSYLFFDWNNLSSVERKTIYNQLLINMAFVPATTSFSYNLLNDESLVTETKADALLSYMYLAIAHEKNNDGNGAKIIKDCLTKILRYQYPDISPDIANQLTDIADGDDNYAHVAASQILLDPNYAPSINHGLKHFISDLYNITAYPESQYQTAKFILKKGVFLNNTFDKLADFGFNFDPKLSESDYDQKYHHVNKLISDAIAVSEEIDNSHTGFLNEFSVPVTKVVKGKNENADILLLQRKTLLDSAFANYKKIMSDDFDSFITYTDHGNAVISDLNYDALSSSTVNKFRFESLQNIDNDYDKLKDLMLDVNNTGIFDRAKTKDNSVILNYKVLLGLLKITYVSDKDLNIELSSPVEFETQYKRILSIFQKRRSILASYLAQYQDNDNLQKIGRSCNKILNFNEFERKVLLTHQLLDKYPSEDTSTKMLGDIKSRVAVMSEDYNYEDHISVDLASEALGYFDLNPEFTPLAATYYINPIVYLSRFEASRNEKNSKEPIDNSKIVDPFTLYIDKNERLDKIQQVIGEYADSFVNYWGDFPDSVKPHCADYYAFHEFAAQSKAYQINSQLLSVYNFAYDLLTSVKVDTLNAKTKTTKDLILKRIEDRRKVLTLDFTSSCTNVLNAWALLPEDPIKANHYVKALDKKTIRNDFTLVRSLGNNRGNIPWWTSFVNLGTALLKTEATYQTAYGLEQFQNRLYYFPILRDASPDSMSLKIDDMPPLKRALAQFGLVSKKKKNDISTDENEEDVRFDDSLQAKDEGVDNLQEPLLGSVMAGRSDVTQWVTNVNSILSILGDKRNPLTAKVSIPPLDKQQQLIKSFGKKYDNATVRYRYIDVTVGEEEGARYGTVAEKGDRVIFDDTADRSNFKFNFYRYSDSPHPDATISFDGDYAALRMYLAENAVYDPKTHASYIPINIKDKLGDRSIMFLKITFSKELLRPEDWPSTYNWPLISQF